MSTFSRTVSSKSSVSCCGTTPSRARICAPSVAGSLPRIRSVPAVTGETQPIIRIVELLPAPFGPRKPNASPCLTSRSMPSTATSSPKRLTRPRAWIMAPFSLTAATYLRRPDRPSRRLDVPGDLVDQPLLALEDLLVAEALPELDDEAACRRDRRRSRAGTARSGARRRRSADWCRSRSPRGDPALRRRRCRTRARADPARPPGSPSGSRACRRAGRPPTTIPSSSGGRPSSRAAACTSPSWSACRISVDETPSSSGTGSTSKPEPFEQLQIAAALASEAEVLARDDDRCVRQLGARRTPPAPAWPRRA